MPKSIVHTTYSNETHWLGAVTEKLPENLATSHAALYRQPQHATSLAVFSFAFRAMQNTVRETGETFALNEMQRAGARLTARRKLEYFLLHHDPIREGSVIRDMSDTIYQICRSRAQNSPKNSAIEAPHLACTASLGHVLIQSKDIVFSYGGDVAIWVDGDLLFSPDSYHKPFTGDRRPLEKTTVVASVPRRALSTIVMHSAVTPMPQAPVTSIADVVPNPNANIDFAALEIHF